MSRRSDSRRDGGAAQQRVLRRDLTMYARVLRLPDLPGFAAVSERDFAKDQRACRQPNPTHEFQKKPLETTGWEHPQVVWALETATFATADVPDEFALCPPAQAMERWIRSRTEPLTNPDAGAGAGAGARKKKKARHGREAIANSAKAPEGSFCNALNIALTLRQRMAAVTCRQDERNSKFFDLRKKYINLLRQNQAEHKEQIGAVSNLRAALHKAGISPDNPRSRSQLSRRVVVLSQQVAELRRRLGTSRASGAASEDTDMGGDDAPALDHVPVFVSGDEVMTPYGPGVVLAQRDNDAMCSVRLTWGATVYATPADVRLREPQDNAAAASAAGAAAAAAATHVDGVEVRPNKRKLFRASLLDTGRGVSAKVARLKQSGEDEALAAVAAENEYEHKRRKEDLKTAEVHVATHRAHPERGLALRLDPVRGNPTSGFVHGIRGDGGSPRGHATRAGRTPMSPAARPTQRGARSFNTPGTAVAFEELQKLKAQVQRLKWKLKQTEDERNEQRGRLTEAREARSEMLKQVNALRAELAAERNALEEQQAITAKAEEAAAKAKEALLAATHVNGNRKASPEPSASGGDDGDDDDDDDDDMARRDIRRSGSMSAMMEAAEAAAAAGLARSTRTHRHRGGDDDDDDDGDDDDEGDDDDDAEMASYRAGDDDEDEDEDDDDDGDDDDASESGTAERLSGEGDSGGDGSDGGEDDDDGTDANGGHDESEILEDIMALRTASTRGRGGRGGSGRGGRTSAASVKIDKDDASGASDGDGGGIASRRRSRAPRRAPRGAKGTASGNESEGVAASRAKRGGAAAGRSRARRRAK